MFNSKLLELIKSLTQKELKQLKKFVHSPYHNEHRATTALFDYIFKTAPRFMHTRLERQRVFKHIFPNKKYSDVEMRLVMSYLYKVIEAFLIVEQTAKVPLLQKTELMAAFRQRNLEKHFKSALREGKMLQEKEPYKNDTFFYHQFQIEHQLNQFIEQQQNRDIEPNLQQLSDSLDAFYLIHKLKLACAILNYKNLSQTDYQLPLVDEILLFLKKISTKDKPTLSLYHLALLTLTESNNEAHFTQLKKLLLGNTEAIDPRDLRDVFVLARNFCIKRINHGESRFVPDLFAFYETEIEHNLLLVNGVMPPSSYKNVVAAGLILKKYEWTEQFIKQFKEQLAPEFRHNAYLINLARLYSAQQRYDDVIPLLHEIDHNELFMALSAKAMLVRTYYELGEEEALYSLLDSFAAFLKRKKVIAYHRTPYLNLIKFVKKMLQWEFASKEKLEQLKMEIEQNPKVVDRAWLLKKIDKLLNG